MQQVDAMGISVSEVAEFVRKDREELGSRLAGRFSDIDIDSVKAVRDIREQ